MTCKSSSLLDPGRSHCLIDNNRIQEAISILVEEFEEDYFLTSLKECMVCHQGMDRNETINLHCQLKSVLDILRDINKRITHLQQSSTCGCNK